jgi:hypothetical protein
MRIVTDGMMQEDHGTAQLPELLEQEHLIGILVGQATGLTTAMTSKAASLAASRSASRPGRSSREPL